MAKKYRIRLSPENWEHLQSIVKADKAASKRQRAQILLAPDASKERGELRDEDVAKVPDVSIATVECTHCALCEHGLEVVAHGWPPHRKVTRTKLDGWAEAHLAVATYSPPPKGAARFTRKLLGDHLVGLGLVDCLSNPHIGRPLKERSETGAGGTVVPAPPARQRSLCLHAGAQAYSRPRNEKRALVCLDELERSGDSQPQAARRAERSDGKCASSSSLMCATHRQLCRDSPQG